EVYCVLSAGGGQGSADGRGADGDPVHGGVRGQDSHAGPQQDRRRWAMGGGPVASPVLRDSRGAGGPAAVSAVGDGAQRVLLPAAPCAPRLYPAVLWTGGGQCH